jgi:3'-5' exoribonuclease
MIKKLTLNQINNTAQSGNRFKGKFVLTSFITKQKICGEPYWKITLSDSSGEMTIYCREPSCIVGDLQPHHLVDIELRLEEGIFGQYYCCKYIELAFHQSFTSLTQLPISLCAIPHSMTCLIKIVSSVQMPCLRKFILDVLAPLDIGLNFISVPGSLNYHHNYRSGLILHTVEVCRSFLDDVTLTPYELDLAITATIMHDIGKTKTLTPDMQRTATGMLVDHDDLTLEICAKALQTLSLSSASLADELRHAWTCGSPNSRYGFKPKTNIAIKLQSYDRQSAQLS